MLQEAISTRNPELVRLVLRYRDYQRTTKRLAGIPRLLERLRQVNPEPVNDKTTRHELNKQHRNNHLLPAHLSPHSRRFLHTNIQTNRFIGNHWVCLQSPLFSLSLPVFSFNLGRPCSFLSFVYDGCASSLVLPAPHLSGSFIIHVFPCRAICLSLSASHCTH